MADGFRILENGDIRFTESSDTRITENFVEAFASLSVLGSKISAGERTAFGYSNFTSTGTIADVVTMNLAGVTNLTGTATLSPLATGTSQAEVALSAEGIASIYPISTSLVYSDLQAVGSKAVAGIRVQFPSSLLSSLGSLASLGAKIIPGTSNLSSLGSKASAGIRIQYGLFDKTGTGTLSPSAVKILNGFIEGGTTDVTRITEAGDIRVLENGTDVRAGIQAEGNIIAATMVGNGVRTLFSSEPYYKEVGTWRDMLPYVKWNGAWTGNIRIYKHTNGAWKRSY
jgi:hypothetical protein